MLKNIDIDKTAILVDFDGTITTEDTNDKLIEYFSNTAVEEFLKNNNERDMTYVDFMDQLFSKLRISEKEYLDFILNEIEISNGFIEFYKQSKELNIPVAIISGGFRNGIVPFLNKYGIDDMKIFANSLKFNKEDMSIEFYHSRDPKCCHIGYCGNCKTKHISYFRNKFQNIIFIGDGITDEPVASQADIVFAKDSLLEYCKEHRIDYIRWEDFIDISKIILRPTK